MLQIVTDSSCDLPPELLQEGGIGVVPLTINIDGEYFREGVDICPETFYKKMAESVQLPKTSQPTPAAFAEVFSEMSKLGPVLCLTISSKLSGTFQSACLGRDLAKVDATVFDSLAGSLGHGLQVLRACALARAGCAVEEAVAELAAYRQKMKILILLNTLDNIVKGGRLSRFQGSLGKILDMRILLHNKDGEVAFLEKVRGKKRFLERVLKAIYELRPDMTGQDIGLTHFNNPEDTEFIRRNLFEKCFPRDCLVNHMGPTMATYAGEGGIIVAF